MVGKRVWTSGPDGDKKKNGNLKPAISRFQDASNKAVEDDQREQIKNKLIDGVEREALEHYRKSKDEVSIHPVLRVFPPSLWVPWVLWVLLGGSKSNR